MKNRTRKTQPNKCISIFILTLLIVVGSAATYAAPRAAYFDFFGSGRTSYLDITTSQNFNAMRWDLLRTPVTQPPQTRRLFWGFSSDMPVWGDFDGDLKYDVGVYRYGTGPNSPNYFYIQRSSNPNPSAVYAQAWGGGFADPVTGDYDGDGKDDFAVAQYEDAGDFYNVVWYILPSSGGSFRRIVWGIDGDDAFDIVNTPGADFNGDGRDDLVVTRIEFATGDITFFVGDSQTGALILAQPWGNVEMTGGFFFSTGNYIGDNRADVRITYSDCDSNPGCPLGATWWIKETGNDNHRVVKFGIPYNFSTGEGDTPDTGDYDGDGKFDINVLRRSNATYYHLLSSNNQFAAQQWSGLFSSSASSAFLDGVFEPQEQSVPAAAPRATYVRRHADGTFSAQRGAEIFRPKKNRNR